MARLFAVPLIVLLTSLPSCAPPKSTTNAQDDVTAINKVRNNEVAALVPDKTSDILTVFTTDAVFTPPNEPQFTGNANIKKWVDDILDQNTATARYTSSTVDVSGDWAIERYVGEFTLTPKKGGSAVTEHVRGIHVYQRQPDGSWRIAQDIWNAEPTAAPQRRT
jgi:uncharacterized protein (TIGR02246 family)